MRTSMGICAGAALLVCVWSALAHLWGTLTEREYKNLLLAASVIYFMFAILWATRGTEKPPGK